ncbi:NAD(P)-dependent oxidoreductase [Oxalicibacterium flavum]|uniref:dTDP-4-dehydrorhamnose reductase n=1 Tax=Oxalicibacterium flavum TaxID=179467 RepID=A0A8J2UPL9_9BURK|nr:dTDP-4-dehydrorhamnose reductase [Oxalicibacterium flavum]GGC05064.1 NAD(P)-dependent oxidoreductase [Oxalicibacterium flavum]
MKILLTGKTGQIGHELARLLPTMGEVVSFERVGMDLSDLDQVRATIRTVRPALIINPAAYTAVDLAEKEVALAMRINAEAPAIMAEEAARLGAMLVHYSTDYVFDGDKQGGYVEEDETHPLNTYGRSKLAGEETIRASGVPHLILRTSWVYGLHGRNFLQTVRRLAHDRTELRIVADQFGTPTWARTVAQATVAAVKALQASTGEPARDRWHEQGGLYHLTAQGRTSWCGFAQAIVDKSMAASKPVVTPITTADYPLPARRPANSILSSEKFIRTFGILPAWDEALTSCLTELE